MEDKKPEILHHSTEDEIRLINQGIRKIKGETMIHCKDCKFWIKAKMARRGFRKVCEHPLCQASDERDPQNQKPLVENDVMIAIGDDGGGAMFTGPLFGCVNGEAKEENKKFVPKHESKNEICEMLPPDITKAPDVIEFNLNEPKSWIWGSDENGKPNLPPDKPGEYTIWEDYRQIEDPENILRFIRSNIMPHYNPKKDFFRKKN